MLKDMFFALWFFIPAGVANMMPVFAAKVPVLDRLDSPLDGGRKFRGQRVFGPHKTWRGLVVGIIFATLTLWLQEVLVRHTGWLQTATAQVNYANLPILLLGPLFAIGALGGDALESFFKRQRGILSGQGWFPFDQIDYIIGGAILTLPVIRLRLLEYVWLLLIWIIVHVVASSIGYLLGFKDRPI